MVLRFAHSSFDCVMRVARHREAGGGYVPVDWQAEVSACTRGEVRLFDYNGSKAKGVKIINQPCPHSYHV